MNAVTEVMDELRKALSELEDCRARNADLRTMLEQVTRERDEARERLAGLPAWQHACEQSRLDLAEAEAVIARRDTQLDEARAACPDCAMWAERSARWHDDMQRAERERDEARAELSKLREDYDSVLEANVGLLDGAPYVDARAAFRRGAEAMREACAEACWSVPPDAHPSDCAFAVNAMPIPEEP